MQELEGEARACSAACVVCSGENPAKRPIWRLGRVCARPSPPCRPLRPAPGPAQSICRAARSATAYRRAHFSTVTRRCCQQDAASAPSSHLGASSRSRVLVPHASRSAAPPLLRRRDALSERRCDIEAREEMYGSMVERDNRDFLLAQDGPWAEQGGKLQEPRAGAPPFWCPRASNEEEAGW